MNWTNTAADYRDKLQATLDVQRHAKELLKIKAVEVPLDLEKNLSKDTEIIKKQLERLKNNEFRIAVVGLEKAGKSTFVNAWLEVSLLPAASERCTFTTTQIYSVQDDLQQRLEVYPKTEKEFTDYIENLEIKASGSGEIAKNAKADLDVIKNNQKTLQGVIEEGQKHIPIVRLADSMEDVKKYVADVAFAHAIREVRLYTSKLAESDGIVFFDVPGLDSGLGKHLEESRNMLSDCDAVICIQNSNRPSLVDHQQKLVEFVAEGDGNVGVAGKLFVFAGKTDIEGSLISLEKNLEKIRQEWRQRGQLPEDHIIEGSAAGYLLLRGLGDDTLKEQAGEPDSMKRKLVELYQLAENAAEDQIIEKTGIPLIKARIKRYLDQERDEVLEKRCKGPISTIFESAEKIYAVVAKKFSENPDEVRKKQAANRNINFSNWMETKWKEIETQINQFHEKNFKKEGSSEELPAIENLREKYNNLVRKELGSLKSISPKERQDLFDRESRSGFDAKIINASWRKDIYDRDIHNFIDEVSDCLSNEIIQECEFFIAEMTRQLWGAKEVKIRMLDNENFKLRLESGLKTLFLRFSRPVAEALIRGPLGSERRRGIISNLGMDIELLDNYMSDEEEAFNRLKKYAKYGKSLITDHFVRKVVLKISPPAAFAEEVLQKINSDKSPEPLESETIEDVITEVENDLKALEKYLIEGVFKAAGFKQFFIQETKKLLDNFVTEKATWRGVIQNEYAEGNPELIKELPEELKETEFDLEISEKLKQLRLSIENAREKGLGSK